MVALAATGFTIQSDPGVITDLSYLAVGSDGGTSGVGLPLPYTYQYFDLFNINGINPDTTVTFTFGGLSSYTYALSNLNISGCDTDAFGNIGVFSSDGNNLRLPCTNTPSNPSGFYTETDNQGALQIQLTFSCSNDPKATNSCTLFPTSCSGVDVNGNSANFDWGFIVTDNAHGQGLDVPDMSTQKIRESDWDQPTFVLSDPKAWNPSIVIENLFVGRLQTSLIPRGSARIYGRRNRGVIGLRVLAILGMGASQFAAQSYTGMREPMQIVAAVP